MQEVCLSLQVYVQFRICAIHSLNTTNKTIKKRNSLIMKVLTSLHCMYFVQGQDYLCYQLWSGFRHRRYPQKHPTKHLYYLEPPVAMQVVLIIPANLLMHCLLLAPVNLLPLFFIFFFKFLIFIVPFSYLSPSSFPTFSFFFFLLNLVIVTHSFKYQSLC